VRSGFAVMIAHDFRAPLQVIQLLVSKMLRSTDENQTLVPLTTVRRIERSVTRLTQMTNDLLDASRTEQQRFSLKRQSVAADELTRGIVDQLSPFIEDHPIEVSAEAGLPRVLVDPLRIDQILTNLIDNAARHSANKAPISLHLAGSAGGVLISVQDRGVGIPADELPKLFDRYYQARLSSVKRAGLGLGLYIVKGLVEAHGGRIWVESQVEKGSTFYLWLPAEPSTA
jgi:signal transduction histidine kinase